MIVCLCNSVSDRDIRQAACEGASTLQHLSDRFNLGMCCGACKQCAADCLNSAVNTIGGEIQSSVPL